MARGLNDLIGHLRRRAARPGGAHAPPDAELLARFAAGGDEAAFELLVWRHSAMVLGTCRRVLRDEQDSEAAFQAAFLALARRAGSISQGGSVCGWLHQVALRAAMRARSGRSARRVREQPLGDQAPASSSAGPCAEAAGSELGAALDEEVARLPQPYREALVLCCLSGKSNAEAARELGCAVGTVESRLARARQRLRGALERRGHEAPPPAAMTGGAATPGLVSSTVGAAVAFAAGRTVSGAGAAAALAEEVLGEMVMGKLKGLGALALAACLLGLGAFWLGQGGAGSQHAVARAPAPLPARRAAPQKGDAELILGTWRMVKGDASGKHLPREVSTEQRWTFAGRRLTIDHGDGEASEAGYTLDPAARPRTVDLTFDGPPWRGRTFEGIYELKGDRLRVRYSRAKGQRPAAFDLADGVWEERGTVSLVFERERPQRRFRAGGAEDEAKSIDLGKGNLRFSKEGNDGSDTTGLIAVAAPAPAGLEAPELFRLAPRGVPLAGGGVELFGKLPGPRSVSDDLEVLSFQREGGRITADVKHVYYPQQHHVNKTFFLRASLPPLPPGRYTVVVRFHGHRREGERVDPVPEARPAFAPLGCAFTVPAAGGPQVGGKQKGPVDLEKLQGRWEAVAAEADGKGMGQAELQRRKITLSIEAGNFTLKEADAEHFPHGTFRIDPTARPKAMDLDQQTPLAPRGGATETSLAIYKLEGNTLTVCQAAPGGKRPTEFTAVAGSGRQFLVFERQRP